MHQNFMILFPGGIHNLLFGWYETKYTDIVYEPFKDKNRLFQKIMYKFSMLTGLFFSHWLNPLWYNSEKLKSVDSILIFSTFTNTKLVKKIREKNQKCKINIFYWNTITKRDKIKKDKKICNAKLWSFDKGDCEKYALSFVSQFYEPHILENKANEYDAVFFGRTKNRLRQVLEIKALFEKNNLKHYFHIVPSGSEVFTDEEKKHLSVEALLYRQTLDYIAKSKAVIDIVIPGQTGLTLRPLEALFYNKKLITNNSCIKGYDFYNPQNVFILGEDDEKKFCDFIKTECISIDNSIKEKYRFHEFIKNFI